MFGSGDAHSRLVAAIQKVSLWDRNPYLLLKTGKASQILGNPTAVFKVMWINNEGGVIEKSSGNLCILTRSF
jgi:hypothetical protein